MGLKACFPPPPDKRVRTFADGSDDEFEPPITVRRTSAQEPPTRDEATTSTSTKKPQQFRTANELHGRARPGGAGPSSTAAAEPAAPVRGRTGGRPINTPGHLQDYLQYYSIAYGSEVITAYAEAESDDEGDNLEPLTYAEAMASPHREDWLKAMQSEMASILANKTYTLVECPDGAQPIRGKWVFKIKRTATGEIERFKCRYVIKGFMQRWGEDYFDTYAPVARLPTIRTVLAMAAAHGWKLHQVDADTAFLHGELKETVYMVQPEGFDNGDATMVCKLNKCLYGLKQAPRVWHETLTAAFAATGFTVSTADQSVLILEERNAKTFALIYVDDQIITGPDEALNLRIKKTLLDRFPGKDLGEAGFFVGIRIERNFETRVMKLSQTRHIDDFVKSFGQTEANPVWEPMGNRNSHYWSKGGSPALPNKTKYMSLVGSLLYLAMSTRPDIAYAASFLSRYMASPTENHFSAALQVLRYLKTTRTYGLVYGTDQSSTARQLVAYSDSNFAGDREDSISTYGFTFQYNGAAVAWRSKKQDGVAHSTAEAEYVAASNTSREARWFRKLMADCDISGPITVCMDNTAALKYVEENAYTPKTRHIAVHYHAAIQAATRESVTYKYVESKENLADIFTKPLTRQNGLLEKMRTALGVLDVSV